MGQLLPHDDAEGVYGGLGRAVDWVKAQGHEAEGGAREQERGAQALSGEGGEVRDEEPREEDRSGQVRGDLRADGFWRVTVRREDREGLLNAGIDEDGVKGWVGRQDLRDVAREGIDVCDVLLSKRNDARLARHPP